MLKGYVINQKRLEYFEKTFKLIGIASRVDEELQDVNAKSILKVISDYSKALNILDDYDRKTLKKQKGNYSDIKITYNDCIDVINKLRFNNESDIFALERNRGLESIINDVYQTFDSVDVYPTLEENFIYDC